MAFFTSQQLFGDGSGSPGDPGWVPIELSAPPTFSANNRGIAFGEQLTSAIANRPHYALALNDDDLNTRLALFETGGLDTAYDLGAAAVDGGGREITKDGGAVETISALASQLEDDRANAHFRANMIGDAARGGGGFDAVAYGRGVSALYGFVDRRAMNFAGVTAIDDTEAATLAGNTVTLTAGQVRDGSSNTHLLPGYDLVEILNGVDAGLYVLATLTGGTTFTILNLDGSTPALTIAGVNVRFYRAMFGSFNKNGQTGTFLHQGNFFSGGPTSEAAVDLVPGSTLGRFDTTLLSPDGARYALRSRWKNATGGISTRFEIDSQGQARSYVSSTQLATAQLATSPNFGSPAYMVQQDESSTTWEVGFMARSYGELATYLGLLAVSDIRTPTTTDGEFDFDFDASVDMVLSDVNAADWYVSPTFTFVEILTPSAQAGVYRITGRDSNNGELTVTTMNGDAVSFPAVGSGTCRLLHASTFGARDMNLGDAYAALSASTRATAVIEAPGQDDSTALLLHAPNNNLHYLLRGVMAEDGGTVETCQITSAGAFKGRSYEADNITDGFTFRVAQSRVIRLNMNELKPYMGVDGLTPGWAAFPDNGGPLWTSLENGSATAGYMYYNLNSILRHGVVITNVEVIVTPGANRAGANRVTVALRSHIADFSVLGNNPVSPSTIASNTDAGGTSIQTISLSAALGAGHTVVRDGSATARDYWLKITAGNTGAADPDTVWGIRLTFSDPGPRNN